MTLALDALNTRFKRLIMKKFLVGLSIASFAFTLAAHAGSESHRTDHLGRHGYDNANPQASVPEAAPTFALLLVGMASLGVAGVFLNRKES